MKSTGKPTAITMCIGPTGDSNKVSPGDCAVRLARAGTVQFSLKHVCKVGVVTRDDSQRRFLAQPGIAF